MRTSTLLLSAMLLLACKPKGPPPVEPSDQERYELPSHRCTGSAATCVCRDGSTPEDAPEKILVPTGYRRFEMRLASVDPALLVGLSGQPFELRPNSESGDTSCWYFDLPIGQTEVSLRAREYQGTPVHATLSFAEYLPESQLWFPVVQVRCGSAQQGCGPDELSAKKQAIFSSKDRCARSEVKELHWNGGVDQDRYLDLDLRFQILVNPMDARLDPKCPGAPK
jgi:hypothetical protein